MIQRKQYIQEQLILLQKVASWNSSLATGFSRVSGEVRHLTFID